ncbi:DUF6366 family protein [Clostridium cylindrosporum]|uniref:Uncharacterized protein n=1 Tax=Clostridium cylindrosporum DSM 605 TaxID=1121307 RepID=A0A0J8DE29_CLOCY|nr:DUF6366 family protein [Clostridium cylindrosporum]KMT22468.1 hypothetical protein CLCY_10c00130 [Clostridium cylindrosporum DSM 605]
MNINDGQDKEEKRKIEEYKKHPMINLADSINHSKIGDLSQLTKGGGGCLIRIITTVIIIGILFFLLRTSN